MRFSFVQKSIVVFALTSGLLSDVKVTAWAEKVGNILIVNKSTISLPNVNQSAKYAVAKAETLYLNAKNSEVIKQLQEALTKTSNLDERALIYSNLGVVYRRLGKTSEAISQWQQAIEIYQSFNQETNLDRLKKLLVDQAQAYIAIGQQQQAINLLQKMPLTVDDENTQFVKGTLGNAYFALGQYELAIAAYQESISSSNSAQTLASGWMNLGNVYIKLVERYKSQRQVESEEGNRVEVLRLQKLQEKQLDLAHDAYSRSLQQNSNVLLKSQSLLNLARLVQGYDSQYNQEQQFNIYLKQASTLLASASPSRSKVYALIDLAKLYQDISPADQLGFLQIALSQSKEIGDSRGETFVLGAIAKIYEARGDLDLALRFTSQAQWLAQANNFTDSLYLWQWQLAKIFGAKGERSKSIDSYRQAIATIQSIRGDIVAADRSFQLDVRDSVEPIYRELIEILLSEAIPNNYQPMFEEAIQISELLRLSELQNFFGDECIQTKSISNQKLSSQSQQQAAQIYSIMLDKQTFIVVRLPDNSFRGYVIPLSKDVLRKKIKYLRFTLENVATNEYLTPSQELYDLIIRPIAEDLLRSKVELLVFIHDDVLRSVPMSALHDGKKFLVQKYPIIYLVGSRLPDHTAELASKSDLVAFGLSEAVIPFSALPNVLEELKEVSKIWKSKMDGKQKWNLFLNRDFTFDMLQTQVKKGYEVVHLATHAKFGATPESAFLQAFDRKISLDQIESILRSSKIQIDLLVLSACQTAAGDNRSTLGLTGVALRSGVKNVLASLWAVDDIDVVPLIKDFYNEWQINGLTKAQALQKSQIKSITKDNLHPASWSAFILVGN